MATPPAAPSSFPLPPPLPTERPSREPLAFREWWDDLLWPRVLAGAGLGLRPNRIGLAFFAYLGGMLLLNFGNWLDRDVFKARVSSWEVWQAYQLGAPSSLIWRYFVQGPIYLVRNFPVSTLVIGPVLLVVLCILLGAISRMAAVEVSHGRRATWTEGLGFSTSRWVSLAGAMLSPIALVWVVALFGAIFGFLFFNVPVLNVIGAALFGLVLVFSLLAALCAGAYLVGGSLLVPAVMCEGTDSIDAIQRVFAYATGRLPRLLLYRVLAGIGVAFVTGVIGLVLLWGIDLAAESAGAWAKEEGHSMIWHAVPMLAGGFPAKSESTWGVASWVVGLWFAIPIGVLYGTFLSCAASAATVVYLAMRQVCDGQDMAELWEPGAVEASMADAVAARGVLAKQADTGEVAGEAQED